MSLEVWIASHLGQALRLDTLVWALYSIKENTSNPDVVKISFSFDSEIDLTEEDIKKVLQDCLSGSGIIIKLFPQPKKTMQFEHFHKIYQDACSACSFPDPNTIICFLDDDDLVSPNKYEMVKTFFTNNPTRNLVLHNLAVFGMYDNNFMPYNIATIDEDERKEKLSFQEFCCFSLRFHLIKEWFENCQDVKYQKYFKGRTFLEILEYHQGLTDLQFRQFCVHHLTTENPETYCEWFFKANAELDTILHFKRSQRSMLRSFYQFKLVEFDSEPTREAKPPSAEEIKSNKMYTRSQKKLLTQRWHPSPKNCVRPKTLFSRKISGVKKIISVLSKSKRRQRKKN